MPTVHSREEEGTVSLMHVSSHGHVERTGVVLEPEEARTIAQDLLDAADAVEEA